MAKKETGAQKPAAKTSDKQTLGQALDEQGFKPVKGAKLELKEDCCAVPAAKEKAVKAGKVAEAKALEGATPEAFAAVLAVLETRRQKFNDKSKKFARKAAKVERSIAEVKKAFAKTCGKDGDKDFSWSKEFAPTKDLPAAKTPLKVKTGARGRRVLKPEGVKTPTPVKKK